MLTILLATALNFFAAADCKTDYGQTACGYHCVADYGQVRCAQSPSGRCQTANGKVVCFDPSSW